MTSGKVAAFSWTWLRANVTNLLPDDLTEEEPIKAKKNKKKTETPAAAKYTKEKQQKRIWKNPRLYRRSSTKLVSRLARQSKRRVYLLRAQQALSLTVPLSYHISIIYSALPSYQPCSALKCQKLPHISPSMQTASGKGKKCSLLQNIHHAIHLWRCTPHVQQLRVSSGGEGFAHPIKCSQHL